jgi:zinc protease
MKRIAFIFQRAAAAAGLLLAASLAFAQGTMQPQSTKGVEIKGKAPVSKEVLKVNLPKPYETRLSNGLQVIVLENHKLPTFSMQMVVLSGGLADPADQHGLAQFTASLLREGTKTRSSKQLAEQIEALGASLSAGAGLSSLTSTVTASGLTDNFDRIMELFADVILNPTFPADEVNKLKVRTLNQLRAQRSFSGFLAAEMFAKVMYGEHPAARIAPSAAELQRLTPEMLQKFHAAHYKPNNALFAIVGDVKPAEIVAKLEKTFGSWQRGDVPATSIPKAGETGPAKIHLIDRSNSVQTDLTLGTLSIERTDPDYFALQVMNQVLGSGPSSRLFMNLREDKGYTYGAYSSVSALKYRGTFQISTQVRTDVTDGSMKELMYEIKRIREEKAPAGEFENAKRAIVGGFALQLESPQSLLSNIVTQKLYGLPADYWDTYPQKISAVTPEEAQRVARKYLDLNQLQVVAVGDAKQIADALRKYGPVEIYDTEGKLLKSPMPEGGAGSVSSSGDNSSLAGTWNLRVKTQNGDEAPVKVMFRPTGANLGGTVDTPFGLFDLTSVAVRGNDVTFKANINAQGNNVEVQFTAKLDGNSMKGSLTSAVFPMMEFTGTKEK